MGGLPRFDWRGVGLSRGEVAYRMQRKLEAVCGFWQELLAGSVFPWFDDKSSQ